MAELNNLEVGDTLTFVNELYSYNQFGYGDLMTFRDVILEVIGIFKPIQVMEFREERGLVDFMSIQFLNTVYVPNEVVRSEVDFRIEETFSEDLEQAVQSNEHYSPVFVLNSPDEIESFVEEVNPLLPDLYSVVTSADQYDSISGPGDYMSELSGYVLIASVLSTILIIGLVVLLFLRDRKHELGIYLSLGEKRGRVIGQIVIEVMTIAVIGITLSIYSGNLLAERVSDMMIAADEPTLEDITYFSEVQTNLTREDVIMSYKVELNSNYYLAFYGIGLLTILISTIIPLIYILRLNPKKILM